MSRKLLTTAGATLVAAGLLAIPPATAYAHTDDAYVLTLNGLTSEYEGPDDLEELLEGGAAFGIGSVNRSDAGLTPLPEALEPILAVLTTGFEVVDEQGWATTGASILGQFAGLAVLYPWDHETGAADASEAVPLTVSPNLLEPGELFEGYTSLQVVYSGELDAQPDGTLLTVVAVRAYFGEVEEEEWDDFLFVASVDPSDESGTVTLLESLDPAAFDSYIFALGGLATDPTDGTTYIILNREDPDTYDLAPVIAEVDLDASDLTLAAGVFDLESARFTADNVDAATVELADYTPFDVSSMSPGPYFYVLGADFDSNGDLWFAALGAVESEEQAFDDVGYLATIPAPFSMEGAAVTVGEMPTASGESDGYFPGLFGPQPAFAIESDAEQLAETGVTSAAAPIAALGVALTGGLLLLLGRRRARHTAA